MDQRSKRGYLRQRPFGAGGEGGAPLGVKTGYNPGECNIGSAEIRRRTQSGWAGLTLTVILWGALIAFRVLAPWRLLLFFPAFFGAVGFLQAAMHFCAGFAMRGVFNFGPQVGQTSAIEKEEFKLKDRRKAGQIILLSALIGIVVALGGFFLAV